MKKFAATSILSILLLTALSVYSRTQNPVPYESEIESILKIEEHTLEIGFWDPQNFADIRQSLPLSYDIPHGHLSLDHILFINDNLYNRSPFSYREKQAAAWIVEELLAMGYTWDNIQVQEFTIEETMFAEWGRGWSWLASHPSVRRAELRRSTGLSQNVILKVPGQSERLIIVGAHYDSYPFPGATDNASGMALLLESAQRMLYLDNYYTIKYVFFGAEEVGFNGAIYFVNELTEQEEYNIVFMINADTLFEGPYLIFGAGFDYSTAQGTAPRHTEMRFYSPHSIPGLNELTEQIETVARELSARHDFDLISLPEAIFNSSDHLPFLRAGFTVVNLVSAYITNNLNYRAFIARDGRRFALPFSHSPRDDFHYIEENWPGLIETNMRAFSIFLEEMLMTQYRK